MKTLVILSERSEQAVILPALSAAEGSERSESKDLHLPLLLLTFSLLATPLSAQTVKVDSETISGLGARNIGSAAMGGRIAAIDAVHEGNRLTVYLGAASGGV